MAGADTIADKDRFALYDWPYVGASGGLAISGSERHAICCSTDVQSGLSDNQSKESKQIPPRFAAERRTQTTKLFDILTKRTRSSADPCHAFFLSNLATARCSSARNCIYVFDPPLVMMVASPAKCPIDQTCECGERKPAGPNQ
jgi:hypothetical protein